MAFVPQRRDVPGMSLGAGKTVLGWNCLWERNRGGNYSVNMVDARF